MGTGMNLAYQLMLGVSLAACAGFRAWLPMLALGIMARSGQVALHPSFQFLTNDGGLIIFGVAAVLEFLGDKFIVIDHFLDAAGTIARPVAGTLIASAMLTKMDPSTALLLGLVAGGGTSLTVHAGKALARAKVSLLAPFHGGAGNAVVSLGEDAVSTAMLGLVWLSPVLAFLMALMLLGLAGVLIYIGFKAGQKIIAFLFHRQRYISPSPERTVRLAQTQ